LRRGRRNLGGNPQQAGQQPGILLRRRRIRRRAKAAHVDGSAGGVADAVEEAEIMVTARPRGAPPAGDLVETGQTIRDRGRGNV
jgi:hypothetical protein